MLTQANILVRLRKAEQRLAQPEGPDLAAVVRQRLKEARERGTYSVPTPGRTITGPIGERLRAAHARATGLREALRGLP